MDAAQPADAPTDLLDAAPDNPNGGAGQAGAAGGGGAGSGGAGGSTSQDAAPDAPATIDATTDAVTDAAVVDAADGGAPVCGLCPGDARQCALRPGGVLVLQSCFNVAVGNADMSMCGASCGAPSAFAAPPSCAGKAPGAGSNCGASGTDDCCASPFVPCGVFSRSNLPEYPATVSDLRLDKFEITVGRFRAFVNAGGGTKANPPAPGAGAHPRIPNSGWSPGWNAHLAEAGGLPARLACQPGYQTWTDAVGPNENMPATCVSWYEAFAFCAWDGGRLPTEAEWNYAAAGGSEQRPYPWGSTAPGPNADLAISGCYHNATGTCTGIINMARVGSVPAGNARWGHADLAGNVAEYVLDLDARYETMCIDCAQLTCGDGRGARGGSFGDVGSGLLNTWGRVVSAAEARGGNLGFRCARAP